MADLKGFTEKYPLELAPREAERQARRGGLPGQRPLRVRRSRDIITHLEAAIPYATEPMTKALRALIQWYRTGEDADRVKYDIAWVQDKDSPVDTINGFIEVYLDARGHQGVVGGHRLLREPGEDRPHPDAGATTRSGSRTACRGTRSTASRTSRASSPTRSTSSSRRAMRDRRRAVGINLPNDNKVREEHGSKSVSLSNIREANDNGSPGTTRGEFSWTPEEVERAVQHGTFAGEMHTNMHEVIGHASGRQSPTFKGTPQEALKEHASALEEARADLVRSVFHGRPETGGAWRHPGGRPRRGHPRRVRGVHAQSPSRNCSASAATPRSSSRITCATARWSCAG